VRHLDIAPRRKHDPQYLDIEDLFRRIGGENPPDADRGVYAVAQQTRAVLVVSARYRH